MGVATIGDRIFAAGGQNGAPSFDTLAVYSVQDNRWETLPSMSTERNHLAAAAVNGIFYAFGGRSGSLRNELEAYDPEKNDWITLSPMPTARGGIAAAVLDESIFVFGGEGNSADPLGTFPHVEAYLPAADCWQRREDMALPRHGIGAAALVDRVFIPGGSPIQGFGVTDLHDAFVPGTSPLGDFDRDMLLTSMDIDILVAEIIADTDEGKFDLSGDCAVDDTDLSEWLTEAAEHNGFGESYLRGDANLDGTVDVADLNALALNWLGGPNAWQLGDFNADGTVNAGDLNEIGQNWQASIRTLAASHSVPEPTTLLLLVIAAVSIVGKRPRI
jgi:hypothetical protein